VGVPTLAFTPRLTLRARAVLVVALALAGSFALSGAAAYAWRAHGARAQALDALGQASQRLRASWAAAPARAPLDALLDAVADSAVPVAAALYDAHGARVALRLPANADTALLAMPATLAPDTPSARHLRRGLAVQIEPARADASLGRVVLATPVPPATLPWRQALAGMAALLAGGTLLGAALAGFVVAPLLPLRRLADAVHGQGLTDARLDVRGGGAVARIHRAVNTLLDDLARQQRALHKAHAALEDRVYERTRELEAEVARRERAQRERETALREREQIMEAVPDVIFALDPQGRLTTFNRRLNAATGLPRDALMGRALADCVLDEDREACADAMARAVREGFASVECRLAPPGGDARYYEITARSLHDAQDRPIGATGTARDVTQRRAAETRARELAAALEQRVSERTAQLEAVNRELESFSYTVSHDLRAPLRSIEGFSRALDEDFGSDLAEGARDYLARVRGAAQRMDGLITGLLDLSRVGRADMSLQQVDFSELASRVAARLAQEEPERQVAWAVAPGLRACADPRLLEIVLDNLLRNAWKYTGKTAQARVEIGARVADAEAVYYVRDNGAGFDLGQAQNLFTPFGRLHREEEFPGTGIGLATVQRIVARHGGRIWAEARPGQGACFHFTLGAAAPGAPGHSG
jgi:PAS domain S-box-containing protein